MVQAFFRGDNMAKQSYLNQIKKEINDQVKDEQKKMGLIAIIDYDMLDLSV